MKAIRTLAAAVAAVLTLGACASSGGGAGAVPARIDGPRGVEASAPTIKVDNRNWADVVVYAMRGGSRVRLGMVTSMSTQTFRVPRSLLTGSDNLRLLVDPIGSSQGYVSEAILVRPGQQIAFNVQNHLSMSSVAVWDRD